MKALLARLEPYFNNLNEKLRLALLLLCALLCLLLGYKVLLSPLQASIKEKSNNINQVRPQIQKFQQQQVKTRKRIEALSPENRAEKARKLEKKLKQANRELTNLSRQYISADRMASVLRSLLLKAEGLSLSQISHERPEPIIIPETSSRTGLWRRRIRITFTGGFYDTLEYLKYISNLKVYLVIESLDYTVVQHPKARAVLSVSTITGKEAN